MDQILFELGELGYVHRDAVLETDELAVPAAGVAFERGPSIAGKLLRLPSVVPSYAPY